MEAASGFEPLHRGFADLSLNHLGTPPYSKMGLKVQVYYHISRMATGCVSFADAVP
jgi:hypothetical protein